MDKSLHIIGPQQLAELLGRSISTIRADACRRPKCLPPRFTLPGSNRLAWRLSTVEHWLDQCEHTQERGLGI